MLQQREWHPSLIPVRLAIPFVQNVLINGDIKRYIHPDPFHFLVSFACAKLLRRESDQFLLQALLLLRCKIFVIINCLNIRFLWSDQNQLLQLRIVQQYTSCPIAATDHPLDHRGLHIRVMVEQNQRKWFVDAVSHNFGHIMIIAGIQKMDTSGSIRIYSPVDLCCRSIRTIQITLVNIRTVDPVKLIIAWDILVTVYVREIQDQVVALCLCQIVHLLSLFACALIIPRPSNQDYVKFLIL